MLTLRKVLSSVLFIAFSQVVVADAEDTTVSKIAFGSCAKESKDQPIWTAVLAEEPDVFVFLGDNIYADTYDPAVIEKKYQKLAEKPGFKMLRERVDVIATWDDHDYGQNDAGVENPIKRESKKAMLDFWGVAEDSPRRGREGGIYGAYYFGDGEHRVQVLLLDLRWNRTKLKEVGTFRKFWRNFKNVGPYAPVEDENAVFLGEAQWQWLEQELQKPAKIRIVGSSLQLLADFTGWESWSNYPRELQRLFDLVKKHEIEGLLVISGDTHWTELSRRDDVIGYPLYDLTSSGLTEEWHQISPNKYRRSDAYAEANFGLITIDWEAQPVEITMEARDVRGKTMISQQTTLDELSFD